MDSLPQAITSRQNKTVKYLRSLATTAKARQASQATILDGIHLCQSYLQSGKTPLSCLVSETGLNNPEINQIVYNLTDGSEIIVVVDDIFDYISPVKNSSGIAFVINFADKKFVDQLNIDTVMLEKVQDPGNIGTIFRTAAAAGIKQVLLSSGCASAWSPQTLRAGMGAHFGLDIFENVDLYTAITQSQVPTYATSLSAKKSIYDAVLKPASAWLFGSEGQGVSNTLLEACTQTVIIPQSRDVESLNVAMSATVCLFEQVRQRQ